MKKITLAGVSLLVCWFVSLLEPTQLPNYPTNKLWAQPHHKYFQEIGAGYSFGAIGWCIGATGTHALFPKGKDAPGVGGYILYTLGSSIGVWITGRQHDDGKFIPTLLGTILFPLTLTAVKYACGIELREVDELIAFSLPIGAFIGYNLSRTKQW